MLSQVTEFIQQNIGWLATLVALVAGYIKLDQKDKASRIERETFLTKARGESELAESAKVSSEANTANVISELALELNRDRRTNTEIMFKLQERITELEKALARANTIAELAQKELSEFKERYTQERREWDMDRIRLVKRIASLEREKGIDTRLEETIPIPNLPEVTSEAVQSLDKPDNGESTNQSNDKKEDAA